MADLLSKDHFEIVNGDKILALNSMAQKAKRKGKKIINATVGMLFDENENLADIQIADRIIRESADALTKSYGPSSGGELFQDGVDRWLFEKVDRKRAFHSVIATIGATGALSLSMRNYCNRGQEILMPSIRWSNYDSIALQAGCSIKEYNLFNGEDRFDLESVKSGIEESFQKYHRAYLLINDPCQNPTGYTMKTEEWAHLLAYLKEKSREYPIILLDDIAYVNYSRDSYDPVFRMMIDALDDQLMIQIAFSASKTLSIYGLRGGALIGLSNRKETIDRFKTACEGTARAIWALPNSMACRVVGEAFSNERSREEIRNELSVFRSMIDDRAGIFLKEAELVNLFTYPYHNGFFVLIPCSQSDKVAGILADRNIFVVPMSGGIRVSLASISQREVRGLARSIRKAIKDE